MPSSKIVETIQPADGRHETRIVLSGCLMLVILAACLLYVTVDREEKQQVRLPNAMSNIATRISNAVDEIQLMDEVDAISAPYLLDDMPLPQDGANRFQQLDQACFVMSKEQYSFIVMKHDGHWEFMWTDEPLTDCQNPHNWHTPATQDH